MLQSRILHKDCKRFATYIMLLKTLSFLGIDLVDPLQETNGKKYIVMAICYFSKYVGAKAIESKNVTEIVEFLFDLICQYGCFHQVLSNQGCYHKLLSYFNTSCYPINCMGI